MGATSDRAASARREPDEVWAQLGWGPPYGFHPSILDRHRMESEAAGRMQLLLGCEAPRTNVPCGLCHNCGAELPEKLSAWCSVCFSSDYDE